MASKNQYQRHRVATTTSKTLPTEQQAWRAIAAQNRVLQSDNAALIAENTRLRRELAEAQNALTAARLATEEALATAAKPRRKKPTVVAADTTTQTTHAEQPRDPARIEARAL